MSKRQCIRCQEVIHFSENEGEEDLGGAPNSQDAEESLDEIDFDRVVPEPGTNDV